MLPILFSLALDSSAPAFAPQGTYTYRVYKDSDVLTATTIVVRSSAAGPVLSEASTLRSQTEDTQFNTSLTLAPTLFPIAYTGTYRDRLLDQKSTVTIAFADRSATMTMDKNSQSFPLGGSSKTFAVFDSGLFSGYFALPAQLRAIGAGDLTLLVPAQMNLQHIQYIEGDHPSRPADVPASDQSASFAGDLVFVEWYDPATLIPDEVILPGENITVRRKR